MERRGEPCSSHGGFLLREGKEEKNPLQRRKEGERRRAGGGGEKKIHTRKSTWLLGSAWLVDLQIHLCSTAFMSRCIFLADAQDPAGRNPAETPRN